jgi:hypothetical protein
MYKKTILTLAVLALASVTALAASKDVVEGVVLSKDGRRAMITKRTKSVTQKGPSDAGLVKIFDNIGSVYAKGTYWCCSGNAIFGPAAISGIPETWQAAAFTPSANHAVTRIKVAVSLIQGTNELILSLNNDASGVPGAAIKTWNLKSLPAIGTCCTVKIKSDAAGIPVSAGQQYWIVLSTNKNNPDTFAIWDDNDTDEVDPAPVAFYCSADQSGSCGTNDAWTFLQLQQSPAFAVLGSN